MASVIEKCQVAPPPATATELLTLPLTYFDFMWLGFHRMRRVLFYKHPISRSAFIQTTIPNLKHSLSLTLKHYIPLAGSLVCPSPGYPELRYVPGDSICVTFSDTDMDFHLLAGNHPRRAKDIYPLVPHLAEAGTLLAIQVTLFPGVGVSIGFTNHHVGGDGATIFGFMRAWAWLNKFNGDELPKEMVPFIDRSVIKDPYGQGMSTWDLLKETNVEMADNVTLPPDDRVRSTFILGRDDIVKLKNLILSRRPGLTHVTSFTVTCGYVWNCLAVTGEGTDENVTEIFGFPADCRGRFDPPIPSSYLGNCIVGYIARARHGDIAGKEGFTIAVELIGESIIQGRIKEDEWILNGEWYEEVISMDFSRLISVAGSPKLDLYAAADFGWGSPEKQDFISIDTGDCISISLTKSKDSDGGLEVGLSLPKTRMDAFSAVFTHGLSFL